MSFSCELLHGVHLGAAHRLNESCKSFFKSKVCNNFLVQRRLFN